MVRRDSAEHLAHPPATAEVRPAATVMLLRNAPGLEVFVLRRVAQMDFAAGMTVFPGGGVDPADHRATDDWLGPDPVWWSTQLGVDPGLAKALVVAAVRELFEETGVLLAARIGDDTGSDQVLTETDRLAILERRSDLPTSLAKAGAGLRADLLRPWANWVTPPGRTRRYDTFFFAAALPPGQRAQMLTSEADLGQWRTPQELLAERDSGSTRLMPPTVAMLLDLAGFESVEDVLASHRVITPVRIRDLADLPAELRERKPG